jgi:hypothetical protein
MSSTPILDLQVEPPRPRSRRWIGVLTGVALGLLIGLTSGMNLLHLPQINGLLFFPAMYVAIAVHEAGHLIAGMIVGMPPGAVTIGGIVIFKSGQRWRARFNFRCLLGGMAKVLPPKSGASRSEFVWMIAGGPIASIILTGACAFMSEFYGTEGWGWIGSLFWAALLTVIVSLIPISAGMNKSDGARILTILRSPEQFRSWSALMALQTEETKGVTPREWDADLVREMLTASRSANEYPYVQMLAFYRSLHEKQEQEALQHLENALATSDRCGKILRQCIFLEAGEISAYIRRSTPQARTWLERTGKVRKPLSTDGVEAGIAICQGRYDEARRHLNGIRLRAERRKLDSGLARFSKENLEEHEQLCESHAAIGT